MNKNTPPLPQKVKVKLLLDADVLIHFFKADKILELSLIFKEYEYILFDVVWEELRQPAIRFAIDLLIKNGSITLMEFPTSDDLIDYEFDYLRYQCNKGMGESACMAYAKYNAQRDGVVASSNLKDLLPYCHDNNIPYVTTLDFLCRAMELELYTELQCDEFIKKVLDKRSDIPIKKMQDYDCLKRRVIKYR
jgi:hypothetical protein